MSRGKGRIRAPQEFAAGLFLIVLATIAFWQSSDLSLGTMRQLGPGMLPRILTLCTGLCGLALLILSVAHDGSRLERWTLRAPLFVLGAVCLFGLTIRPLGLAVAGPLTIVIAGFASSESRLIESVVFAVVMTGFCLLLFKVLLTLPIPVAPWLLGF
jgi:putative tricarboxylic transport membrane protein